MEIPHVLSMGNGALKELERLGRDGVEFSMHAPFFEINLGSFFEDIRALSKEKVMRALDVAARIGASPVVVHPGYTFLTGKAPAIEEKTRTNFLEDLTEIAAYAGERGVKIALENVHMPYFLFYELRDFVALREAVPDLGVALDIGHAFITKTTQGTSGREEAILDDIGRIGIEHLRHVHFHGNRGTKDDHMLMETDVDLGKIVKGLADLGYGGKIVVESYDMEKYGISPVVERLKGLGARF